MNLINKLFCNHRHSIEDHPACFSAGNVNEKQAEKLAKEKGIPWYQIPEYRIGYLDIEADGLKSDFATMLSWCIKPKEGSPVYSQITKAELFNGTTDKRLVENLLDEMSNYKILVGYYSTKYDVPFIRSKALHYGLEFPSYGQIYHFDLYYTVKSKLCLSRNSLDNATHYLGIEGKTPIDKEVWRLAKYGDKEALDEVVDHNIADCLITEKLHEKLEPFAKWTKRST